MDTDGFFDPCDFLDIYDLAKTCILKLNSSSEEDFNFKEEYNHFWLEFERRCMEVRIYILNALLDCLFAVH